LTRAESLLEDAERLKLIHEHAGQAADRGRINGLDVTDYFAVGYVTCLEWHARSRFADLLNAMPEVIQPNEVRSINVDAISQMMEAGVTLADLLGASAKINSLADYTRIFDRVWQALKIDPPLASIVDSSAELAGQPRCLYELFNRRHALVHEIGIAQVGSYILRDVWTFDQAIAHGKMVVSVIKKIEVEISKKASDEFPNKLNGEGLPEDRVVILQSKIEDLERRIAMAIGPARMESLKRAKESIALDFKVQLDFIDAALMGVPKRHYDPTPDIVQLLYRQRYEFLFAISQELDV
jgi:hypothetical protein